MFVFKVLRFYFFISCLLKRNGHLCLFCVNVSSVDKVLFDSVILTNQNVPYHCVNCWLVVLIVTLPGQLKVPC